MFSESSDEFKHKKIPSIFFKLIVKEDFMTDLINVTPEKLKSTAVSFQQTGQNVKRTTSDMLQLVRGISSSIWSGEASSSFINKFSGLEADINKMCKMIEEEAQHLTSIAQEYILAEEQNKQVAATLKNNVIS